MKTQKFKRTLSLFLAMLMCVTTLFGMGTTAFAAEETDEVYLISYPRDGDANYGGEWGHNSLSFMNGWSTATSRFTTIRAMGSYEGNICYCIEPGVPQQTGNTFTKKGEDFWDEYPSSYNSTISPDDIKLFIGRIFQYGYTGTISTSWRSQNEGGDKLAHAVATQLLIWETVVGERDADFGKVSTGGKNAITEQICTSHPLYSQIMSYCDSIGGKRTEAFQSAELLFQIRRKSAEYRACMGRRKVHCHTYRYKQCPFRLPVFRKCSGDSFFRKRKQADHYSRYSSR